MCKWYLGKLNYSLSSWLIVLYQNQVSNEQTEVESRAGGEENLLVKLSTLKMKRKKRGEIVKSNTGIISKQLTGQILSAACFYE